jgi:dihydropteroate synthase
VTGGRNPEMLAVAAKAKVPIILMHMRGTPRTMQRAPRYRDVVAEVKAYLQAAARSAQAAGVAPKNIVLDPGIGFGKTLTHNLRLIKDLDQLVQLGYPVLVGPSRKAFIGKLLQGLPAEQRDWGTAAAVSLSVAHGAHMVRVHEVKAMAMVCRVAGAIAQGRALGSGR